MFIETIRVDFQCAVCGTDKDRIVFPHKTSIENMDNNDLTRGCSVCGDLPMDIVSVSCKLKRSLYVDS